MIVWLASYPRSGNTFLRVILNKIYGIKTYSIYNDKSDIGADEATSDIVGHEFLPRDFDIEKARKDTKLYYIKTHELHSSRINESDKIIYLIRDGRESTLSFTNHQNLFTNKNKNLTDTIYGNTFIGGWSEHVQSWNPKNRANTLLIKFEELTKEPELFIEILGEFINANPIEGYIPNFDELNKINPNFFRSGKNNSWEKVYTEQEHISFWCKNYQQMDEYGYDYKKPEGFNSLIKNNVLHLETIRQNYYLINLYLRDNKKISYFNNKLLSLNNEIEKKNLKIKDKGKKIEELNNMINYQTSELNKLKIEKENTFLKKIQKLLKNLKKI